MSSSVCTVWLIWSSKWPNIEEDCLMRVKVKTDESDGSCYRLRGAKSEVRSQRIYITVLTCDMSIRDPRCPTPRPAQPPSFEGP